MLAKTLPMMLGLILSLSTASGQDSAAPEQNEDRQKIFERLVREIDDLIPGNYEKDSPQKEALDNAVYGFISGNQTKVTESLSKLSQLDPNVPPRELLLAGMAYAANNQTGGKALLEQAAVRHRGHPSIPLAFARLALIQGRFFDALACVEKAQNINAESNLDPDLKKQYVVACFDSLTIIEIRRNELKEAERFAEKWGELAPDSDKMLLASGEIKFLQEKLPEAVSFLNRRSRQTQTDTPTEVIVSKWYQARNDDANYGKWITDAYKKFPTSSIAQIEYAAWLIRSEDFAQAASVVKTYEGSTGETSQTKLIKGRIAFANQEFSAAEQIFTDLLQAQPNNFEHGFFTILSLLESGDEAKRKQAIQLAQRVYQAFPNNQLSTAVAGWAIYLDGNKEAGQGLLLQAKNMGNTLPDTAYFTAKMMAADERNAQAKIQLSPFLDTPGVFVYRAQAKQLMESLSTNDNLPNPGGNN